jgi:hypothetical protein
MNWLPIARGRVLRTVCSGFVSVAVAGWLAMGAPAVAQVGKATKKTAPEAEKVAGKVTEVQRKGRLVTLVIDRDDGGQLEIPITSRMAFSVSAKGDQEFLQPRVGISSDKLFVANNELFGKEFSIHLPNPPGAYLRPEMGNPEAYHISGMIVAADAQSVTVNVGPAARPQKVTFEQGAEISITVISSDPALVEEGSAVEIEGNTRGTKFLPTRVAVTLADPLTVDDVMGDKKGSKTTKTTKTAGSAKTSKSAKGAKDDTTTSDPFGVLGKKDDKDSKPADKKDDKQD